MHLAESHTWILLYLVEFIGREWMKHETWRLNLNMPCNLSGALEFKDYALAHGTVSFLCNAHALTCSSYLVSNCNTYLRSFLIPQQLSLWNLSSLFVCML